MKSEAVARTEADLIEEEISEVRADLDKTIDLIEAKLAPGAILENVLHHASQGTSALAVKVGGALWRQPLGAAIASAGAQWFVSSRQKAKVAGAAAKKAKHNLEEAGAKASERAHEIGDAIHEKAEVAREAVGEQLSHVKDTVGTLADKARVAIDENREEVSQYAETAKQRFQSGNDAVMGLAERNPLLTAVIALAAGGVCAALIPSADASTEPLKRARSNAKRAAQKGKKTLKAKAKKVVKALVNEGLGKDVQKTLH